MTKSRRTFRSRTIPARTPVFAQLQFFQENRQRIGLVGLTSMVKCSAWSRSKTSSRKSSANSRRPRQPERPASSGMKGSALVEGSRTLREINRRLELGTGFPLDGPKTLNGLILDHFSGTFPETGVSIKVAGIAIEIIQTQDKSVRVARLYRLGAEPPIRSERRPRIPPARRPPSPPSSFTKGLHVASST